MADNPWAVESLQAFYFLKCPECNFNTKEENLFENHATENHPLSFVFFDKKSVNEDFGTLDIKEEPLSHYDTQISHTEEKSSRHNQISPIGCITEDNSMLIVPELESYVNEYELEDFERDINNSGTENYSADDAIIGNNVMICPPELKNLKNHKINFGANNDIKCKEEQPEMDIIVTDKLADIFEKDPIHIAAKKRCLKIKAVKNSTNHHSEKRIPFLKKKKKLKRNISKNSKTKECPHCNLSFERNSNLIRHIENKHETVKKGECSRCHKQFGTKSSAERHEQKCILTFTVPDSKPSEIMNPFLEEKKTVKRIMSKNSLTKKCPLCNLFFEKRSNLRRHIENKHEKVKKGECSRCHRQFGTKSSAERHEREQKCTEET